MSEKFKSSADQSVPILHGEVLLKGEEFIREEFIPPTFANRLATIKEFLSNLDADRAINIAAGTMFASLGFCFTAGGLIGDYLIATNISELGFYSIPIAIGTLAPISGGVALMIMGSETMQDRF